MAIVIVVEGCVAERGRFQSLEVPTQSSAAVTKPEDVNIDVDASGIRFSVTARPRRFEGNWGIELQVTARSIDGRLHLFQSTPLPRLTATCTDRDGREWVWGDSCRASLKPQVLQPGETATWSRIVGNDPLDSIQPGSRLEVLVSFYNVGTVVGDWEDMDVATIMLTITKEGVPLLRIAEPQ